MTEPYYERLSTLDASFLAVDDGKAHMHVGSVSLFDARPLKRPEGGLDFARIERAITQILPITPRLRQKVWWPAGGPPVWIDDPGFRVGYHVRHAALPVPGSIDQLKRLAGRIMSWTLDFEKPLWEIWIVEGIEGDRCAVITKIHHSLADGISSRNILLGYLSPEPTQDTPEIPSFVARPAPSLARIHVDAALRRVEMARDLTRRISDLGEYSRWGQRLRASTEGLIEATANLVREIPHTPLNRDIGPHRRFDGTTTDMGKVKEIRKSSGAKVNDVVLAAVTGALRSYFLGKKLSVDDLAFRVMVPVNVRAETDGGPGNRVSNMSVQLPLFETDPRRRLQRVIHSTSQAKNSGQSQVGELLQQLIDAAGLFPSRALTKLAVRHLPANMVVTNVPGPQMPLHLLEGLMYESFPLVPLTTHQALGVAIFSYNGMLQWGLNADWDLVPDLHRFREALDVEMKQLHRAHMPIPLRTRKKLHVVSSVGDVSAVGETAKVEQRG